MSFWKTLTEDDGAQERESEFTGVKGQLLRYLGSWYVLVIAGLLLAALADGALAAAASVLNPLSIVLIALGLVAFPAKKILEARRDA